jgi:hypothetical protein
LFVRRENIFFHEPNGVQGRFAVGEEPEVNRSQWLTSGFLIEIVHRFEWGDDPAQSIIVRAKNQIADCGQKQGIAVLAAREFVVI